MSITPELKLRGFLLRVYELKEEVINQKDKI